MSKPTLSVVVPYYGVEDYIGACLESIRVQAFDDIEVVLVDDGSLDGSRAIADEYVARDGRFRIVEQPNAGIGEARNTGVRNVEGDYFIFVDSDDMITRHALDVMVETIESSGSSFVLCNARRFSRTSGVRQSWTHQSVAPTFATGTHILERPELVRDRMLWNKVYRTSFYRDGGYTFPPIRYEDYPVSFEAHLDALTVDIVPTHGYYWRERESGDSITQQLFEYGNMHDRVVSAEMLLDIAARKASPQVRAELHRYLADVDLVSMVQAFASVGDDDVPRVMDLCHRLIDRLSFDLSKRPRLDQIQYHALKAGDVDLLRELAVFRRDGGTVGGVLTTRKLVRPWRFEAAYPGRGRSTAPRKCYEYPITALTQRTEVTDVRWDGGDLLVSGVAEITHLSNGPGSEITVSVVNGIDRHQLPIRRFDATDQHAVRGPVGFEARLDLDRLAAENTLVWPLRFEVDTTVDGINRIGPLRGVTAGSPTSAPGRWLSPSDWVQPALAAGRLFTLRIESDPVVLEDVTTAGADLHLVGRVSGWCRHAELIVSRRRPLADLRIPVALTADGDVTRFDVDLTTAAVLADDSPDDPFTLASDRRLTLATDFGDFPLLWSRYEHDIAAPDGDRLVSLTRSAYGAALLTHTPLRPSTRRVAFSQFDDGSRVEANGVWWPGEPPTHMTWRRYIPGTDDHVDVGATAVVHPDGTWTSSTPLRDLLPPAGGAAVAPGAPDADWTLFVRMSDGDVPVAVEPGAIAQMPRETPSGNRWFTITSIAGTARTQVR